MTVLAALLWVCGFAPGSCLKAKEKASKDAEKYKC
jgi:hypothetical protein